VSLNRDLATGAFDRFRSLPVWRPAPIVGGLIGDLGRYLLASSLVIGLGLIMGFTAGGGPVGVIAAVVLVLTFASALSWVWTALGLILRSPEAVMNLGFVVLFPLTFMSNIFVDPQTMPGWLRSIAQANPITHLATAARGLMQGTATVSEIIWVLAAAFALTALFAPLTTWLYQRRG
jgi:ABC-2 type transport system permease protein